MTLGWFVLWLLALAVVIPWCTAESTRKKGSVVIEGETQTRPTSIALTQLAPIDYFLDKLKHELPALEEFYRTDPKTLVSVYSDFDDNVVKVNFFGKTLPDHGDNRKRVKHRNAFGDPINPMLVDELSVHLEMFRSLTGNSRLPVSWTLFGSMHEKDVIEAIPDLKVIAKERAKSLKKIRCRNGILYHIRLGVALNIRYVTDSHFYFHPIDGISALAVDRLTRKATMYHAHWNTILRESSSYSFVNKCTYMMKNRYFNKVTRDTSYFTQLLTRMKGSLLSNSTTIRQSDMKSSRQLPLIANQGKHILEPLWRIKE